MTEKPKQRRIISKAKLYVAINEAMKSYDLDGSNGIELLLDRMKDDIVIEATK